MDTIDIFDVFLPQTLCPKWARHTAQLGINGHCSAEKVPRIYNSDSH